MFSDSEQAFIKGVAVYILEILKDDNFKDMDVQTISDELDKYLDDYIAHKVIDQ